jgi:predicted phosphodiesterase
MKYAVISDLHANLEALTAVYRQIDRLGVDAVVCLGDIVGYHANPNECIALLRSTGATCIAGNHDRAALGLKDTLKFGARARRVIDWTKTVLDDASREFLSGLPITRSVATGSGPNAEFESFFCVHGALHPQPNEDIHLSSVAKIEQSLDVLATGELGSRVCFFGHTHHAVVHAQLGTWRATRAADPQLLDGRHGYYLVNPGSVGEPRDGDGRAGFLSFDSYSGIVAFHRVGYDVSACLAKVEAAGLMRDPTALSRSTDWIYDKLDTGRGMAKKLAHVFRSARP